jgi:hypothetical protein
MGNQKGICVFCGIETEHGHEPAFGDSFCNAPLLSGGNVICQNCQHMNTAEIPGAKQSAGKLYRSNAWYASAEGIGVIRFPKKEKKEGEEQLVARDLSSVFPLPERTPRSILLEPPEPPFVISLTRSYKKPTWQALMRMNGGVATSRGHFPVGCDYDCIYIDAAKLREDLSIIDRLRADPTKPGKILLSKAELESGKIGAGGIAKLMDAHMDVAAIVSDLRKRANDPVWGLAVFVA